MTPLLKSFPVAPAANPNNRRNKRKWSQIPVSESDFPHDVQERFLSSVSHLPTTISDGSGSPKNK